VEDCWSLRPARRGSRGFSGLAETDRQPWLSIYYIEDWAEFWADQTPANSIQIISDFNGAELLKRISTL
jgi:hypothetical protein